MIWTRKCNFVTLFQVPDYGYRASLDDEKDNSVLQKCKDNPMFPIGQ